MDKYVYKTAIFSLIVQLLIGLVSVYVLFIKLKPKFKILNEILWLETIVQFIEALFYIILVFFLANKSINVSQIRYFDWFITTPTMLVSLIAFFIFKTQSEQKIDTSELNITDILLSNKWIIGQILFFNALMLISGYLGEIKKISINNAFWFGTLFLIYSFYLIYDNFVGNNLINNYLYIFNFTLWTLYGIAYLLPYNMKNISYNFLDIFSKNINGLLISLYILYL